MARIRTIKPGFWKHEELSELPAETHMLAAALLNYADDEGYFNANPKLVAAECCPLRDDSVSVHEQLNQLENIGYIRRAKGPDGKTYGHVVTFLEHQRINRPNKSEISRLVDFTEYSVSAHTQVTHGKGREEEEEREGNGETPTESPGELSEAFDEYNRVAEQIGLAKVQVRNKSRVSKLRQRLNECGGIEGWRVCMEKVAASDFLSGRKTDFRANFDFLMQSKSFTKLMEGCYDNHKPSPPNDPTNRRRAIVESLDGVEFGGVESGPGGAEGGDYGTTQGGTECSIGGDPSGGTRGVHGADGQVVQLRRGGEHQGGSEKTHTDLRGASCETTRGLAGKSGEANHRIVEMGQSSTDASGDSRNRLAGHDGTTADGEQDSPSHSAQAPGTTGAQADRPEGAGCVDGQTSQAFPDLPAFLDRRARA